MSDAAPLEKRRAFSGEASAARAMGAFKAAWWTANGWATRRLTRQTEATPFQSDSPPAGARAIRTAWREAFLKDAADVAAGLYPLSETPPANPIDPVRRVLDVISDARQIEARRRREGRVEVREEGDWSAYPVYYRQNFHFQTGGWFTAESARRYEAQVEALFSGSAGPMRRRALSLLARHWRGRDQRGLKVVDVACGSGAFLSDLRAAFPRALTVGLDLSGPYLAEARARSGAAIVQAPAERLPFADASLDGLTCVYLFHELPPKVRPQVAAEFARVLKPGAVLAFADSVQGRDAPELKRLLEAFPVFFHEPYYASYQDEDLDALFGAAGLTRIAVDQAFLTKAVLYRRG